MKDEQKPEDLENLSENEIDDESDLDDLVTVAEAARILKLRRTTLDHYRCQGRGPIYRKHGGRVFYKRRSLRAWSRRNRFESTSKRVR